MRQGNGKDTAPHPPGLYDYVEATARDICGGRRLTGQAPPVCRLDELCERFRREAVPVLRSMVMEGKATAHIDINKIPMITVLEF